MVKLCHLHCRYLGNSCKNGCLNHAQQRNRSEHPAARQAHHQCNSISLTAQRVGAEVAAAVHTLSISNIHAAFRPTASDGVDPSLRQDSHLNSVQSAFKRRQVVFRNGPLRLQLLICGHPVSRTGTRPYAFPKPLLGQTGTAGNLRPRPD